MTKEEAIKVVYGIPVTKEQHEALQFLIPELVESEDERIINELIQFFQFLKNWTGDNKFMAYSPYEISKWSDWLEKQKEQKDFQAKVEQRMEYLWDKLPDAHRVEEGNCTPEEWKTLGAYMELEMNFDKGSEDKQQD